MTSKHFHTKMFFLGKTNKNLKSMRLGCSMAFHQTQHSELFWALQKQT